MARTSKNTKVLFQTTLDSGETILRWYTLIELAAFKKTKLYKKQAVSWKKIAAVQIITKTY